MYRAGIWDGKWKGKDGKTGKRDLGSKNGKVGRDMGLFSRFPVHFPFFFKPVFVHGRRDSLIQVEPRSGTCTQIGGGLSSRVGKNELGKNELLELR
jgi:hypothetical protein